MRISLKISKKRFLFLTIVLLLLAFIVVIFRPRKLNLPEEYEVRFEISGVFTEHIPKIELSNDLVSFLSEVRMTKALENPLRPPLPVADLRYIYVYGNSGGLIGYFVFKTSDSHSITFVDFENIGSNIGNKVSDYKVHSDVNVEELNRIILSNAKY